MTKKRAAAVPAPGVGAQVTEPDAPTYLNAEAVGKDPVTIKIVSKPRGSTSQFAAGGWDVDVLLKGEPYTWTIKPNSGNHRRLYKRFRGEWRGKSVAVCVKENMGKQYVAVADEPKG